MKNYDNIFRAIAIIQMCIIGLGVFYLYGYYRGQNSRPLKQPEIMQVDSMHSDIEKQMKLSNDSCVFHFYDNSLISDSTEYKIKGKNDIFQHN